MYIRISPRLIGYINSNPHHRVRQICHSQQVLTGSPKGNKDNKSDFVFSLVVGDTLVIHSDVNHFSFKRLNKIRCMFLLNDTN